MPMKGRQPDIAVSAEDVPFVSQHLHDLLMETGVSGVRFTAVGNRFVLQPGREVFWDFAEARAYRDEPLCKTCGYEHSLLAERPWELRLLAGQNPIGATEIVTTSQRTGSPGNCSLDLIFGDTLFERLKDQVSGIQDAHFFANPV